MYQKVLFSVFILLTVSEGAMNWNEQNANNKIPAASNFNQYTHVVTNDLNSNRNSHLNLKPNMSRNCYDCSSIHDGEGCYNINSTSDGLELLDYNQFVKKCPGEQPYCKVYRVEYLLMDDYKSKDDGPYTPWSIERSCSSECKNFCVTMGGRTKITYCTSCCVGDLCNTDNSSPSLSMYPLTHSILILAVMRVLFQ